MENCGCSFELSHTFGVLSYNFLNWSTFQGLNWQGHSPGSNHSAMSPTVYGLHTECLSGLLQLFYLLVYLSWHSSCHHIAPSVLPVPGRLWLQHQPLLPVSGSKAVFLWCGLLCISGTPLIHCVENYSLLGKHRVPGKVARSHLLIECWFCVFPGDGLWPEEPQSLPLWHWRFVCQDKLVKCIIKLLFILTCQNLAKYSHSKYVSEWSDKEAIVELSRINWESRGLRSHSFWLCDFGRGLFWVWMRELDSTTSVGPVSINTLTPESPIRSDSSRPKDRRERDAESRVGYMISDAMKNGWLQNLKL